MRIKNLGIGSYKVSKKGAVALSFVQSLDMAFICDGERGLCFSKIHLYEKGLIVTVCRNRLHNFTVCGRSLIPFCSRMQFLSQKIKPFKLLKERIQCAIYGRMGRKQEVKYFVFNRI